MTPAEPQDTPAGTRAGLDRPSLVLAGVLLVLGVVLAVDASRVQNTPGGGVIGPAVFPWAVATALVVLGLALGLVSTRGRADEALDPLHARIDDELHLQAADETRPDGEATPAQEPEPFVKARPAVRVALFMAGLIAHALLIGTAGYVVAAVVLFVAVALAFGAPKPVRVLVVGTVLALAVFYTFTLGLGLALPNLGGG